jgi:hypothetical protein
MPLIIPDDFFDYTPTHINRTEEDTLNDKYIPERTLCIVPQAGGLLLRLTPEKYIFYPAKDGLAQGAENIGPGNGARCLRIKHSDCNGPDCPLCGEHLLLQHLMTQATNECE